MEHFSPAKKALAKVPVFARSFLHTTDQIKHSHPFYEIVLVTGGSAVHRIADIETKISKNDIFIIHPGEEHSYSRTDNLKITNIIFQKISFN